MIGDMTDMVARFCLEIRGVEPPSTPQRLGMNGKQLALGVLHEEIEEFKDAETLEDEADALIDLIYYALGRVYEMGLSPRALFEEVHRANMDKVSGDLAKRPGWAGKDAIKPAGWKPPHLEPLLNAGKEAVLRGAWRPKLLVLGYAGHGKDTFCEILRDSYGFRFESSSWHCARDVIMPCLDAQEGGNPYSSVQDCYDDREGNRQFWFNTIRDFNALDATSLARSILTKNDVYCGMRSADELVTCMSAKLFDHIVWIDRSKHVGPEHVSSCTVTRTMADTVIPNNGTHAELATHVRDFLSWLYGRHMIESLSREARAKEVAFDTNTCKEAA